MAAGVQMERWVKSGVEKFRQVAGENTAVERFLKRQYLTVKSGLTGRFEGAHSRLFWADRHGARVGIYAKGSCDLRSVLTCEPLVRTAWSGRGAILKEGLVSDSRSDLLLQTLEELPRERTAAVEAKLQLDADYFLPRLFEKTFTVPGPRGPEEFPKSVICLSIAPDVVRTLYRHREHGYLVDPGGWWLDQSMQTVLADLSAVNWFRQNFASAGKIRLESFVENFTRIVERLKATVGAPIIVWNVLDVEPGGRTHNYQFVKDPHEKRRREFNLALVEMSRRLDFAIVDIDRIFKRRGVQAMIDFNHFGPRQFQPVADEAFGIMRELRVFA
jgi:hypothetical protein